MYIHLYLIAGNYIGKFGALAIKLREEAHKKKETSFECWPLWMMAATWIPPGKKRFSSKNNEIYTQKYSSVLKILDRDQNFIVPYIL